MLVARSGMPAPSPPAEKTPTRQDQGRDSGTDDRAGDAHAVEHKGPHRLRCPPLVIFGYLWDAACKIVHWTGKSSHANDSKLMVQRGIGTTALDGYAVSNGRCGIPFR